MDGCHHFLMQEVPRFFPPRWLIRPEEPDPSGRFYYFIGVFNGGSLFPSPRFVTSTHKDCDNS